MLPSFHFEAPLLLVEEGIPPHEVLRSNSLLLLLSLSLPPRCLLRSLSLDLLQLFQQLCRVVLITRGGVGKPLSLVC